MKVVLTIGGSDTICASGIQGDIKTIMRNGAYAVCAVASLVAKNTQSFNGNIEVSPEFLACQIDTVFADMKIDAVKVGMVTSAELIKTVADKLKQYKPANIVIDPVLPTKQNLVPLSEEAVAALEEELLPLADAITPDLREAELLAGVETRSREWIGWRPVNGKLVRDESTFCTEEYLKKVVIHTVVEWNHLYTFLPDLYAEYAHQPEDAD